MYKNKYLKLKKQIGGKAEICDINKLMNDEHYTDNCVNKIYFFLFFLFSSNLV